MRPVSLGRPAAKQDEQWKTWVEDCFAELELAAQEDVATMVRDFTVSNYTATRTLDAGTATLADVANTLCTLIRDMQNRGMKRSQ